MQNNAIFGQKCEELNAKAPYNFSAKQIAVHFVSICTVGRIRLNKFFTNNYVKLTIL